jgi:glycosyltransferase involved in cell wall biosynthesis
MPHSPLVSVVIIFLNAEEFIQEAIDSAFSQTYKRWELLLVDDGSKDASSTIARRCAEKSPEKVRYLHHPDHQNLDMPASRNLGITAARGEYVAFLDADDVWLPQKLERQVAILEANLEAALVYGRDQFWYSWTGDPGAIQRDILYPLGVPPNLVIQPPLLFGRFLRGQAITPCPTGILVRRAAFEHVGGFEESFRGIYNIYEDQAFYAKLCLALPVIAMDECLDRYRQHPNSSCAIVQKMGQDRAAREFFLNWLKGYLQERRVRDPRVWTALQMELWKHHHSSIDRTLNRLWKYISGAVFLWRELAIRKRYPGLFRR